MKHQEAELAAPSQKLKVTWVGYFSFFLTIIFFSGMFSGSDGWWRVFDFTV